jgi:NAD(P)-dependent dehydrogenase (short-subunit alcohol dehydrogenase family)
MQLDLKNKNILITGATGHLGRALSRGMAQLGANVMINSRSEERCQNLVDDLKREGYSSQVANFDVSDYDSIKSYFQSITNLPLHGLVNNAYTGTGGTIEISSETQYALSYNVTVIATHNIFTLSLPNLRLAVSLSGHASVINIASMYGVVSPDIRVYGDANSSNPPFYGAAKAALIQWTRYAACEFGRERIRVNSISPGPFPSSRAQETAPEFVAKLADKTPLGRVGHPDEMTGIVALLLSNHSTYITGTNIAVDGGWTAW